MPLITPATEYTPLPKTSAPYGFTKNFKDPQMLPREELLPAGDREELLRLWEDTDRMISSQRYPDQEGFKDVKKQMGEIMHSSILIRRIQKLNANLIVEDSKSAKGNAAFYWTDGKVKKYTNASFPLGWVNEFTVIQTDAADLPVQPIYGWRAVLVRLLKFGAITWQQVLDTFGDVHHWDHRGKHWHHNVKDFRG